MPEGLSAGLRVPLIGQAVRAYGSMWQQLRLVGVIWHGIWKGKVQEQQIAPHCTPSSIYNYICMLLHMAFPLVSLPAAQPCLHFNYLVGHISVHGRTCSIVYLSPCYWEALGRVREWCYLTSWDSPGVRGLFEAGKTGLSALASSIPIAELENVAPLWKEIEWLHLLHSSPLAVNQWN